MALLLGACTAAEQPTSPPNPDGPAAQTSTPITPSPQELAAGVKLSVGRYKMFIKCVGQGSPTVILDAGASGESDSWSDVQPKVADFTRVCSYDRTNRGTSDRGVIPNTSKQIVDDLKALLAAADIDGPYLLVGHSYGGLNMQLFARLHPADVSGLVLVDSVHEETYTDPPCAPDGVCNGVDYPTSGAEVQAAPPLPPLPLVVIVHGKAGDLPQSVEKRWAGWQRDLARSSPRGELVVAEKSGHEIAQEQPQIVIDSIREVKDDIGG